MKKIIVMQFLEAGRQTCLEALTKSGIKSDEFQIFSNIDGVEEAIESGERQLLLAGSFHGIQYLLPAFIQLLRDKNPNLICISYCYEELIGPFDDTIMIQLDYKNCGLLSIIRHFQNGTLNRGGAKYEGRPFSHAHYRGWIEPIIRH